MTIVSNMLSGFMDRFGRKKVILAKTLMLAVCLVPLIVLGLVGNIYKQAVFAIYFIALGCSTFTFDLMLFGFGKLPKARENYIILLSATRFVGIAIVCVSFYFLKKFAYFFVIELGLLIIFSLLLMKYAFESFHFVLVSTGSNDVCKYILNSMALINEEDTLTEKIAFCSHRSRSANDATRVHSSRLC